MIQFYKDAELTRPVTDGCPVWIFASRRGSVKRLSLWLADTFSTFTYAAADIGSTELPLVSGLGLAPAGTVVVNGIEVAYSANVNSILTTVAPLPISIPVGSQVYPKLTYSVETSITLIPIGSIRASLKRSDQVAYGIPGVALIQAISSAVSVDATGPLAITQVDLEINVPAGEDADLSDLKLLTNAFSTDGVAFELVATASFRILRGSHGLPQRFRLFTADRALEPERPGFIWGEYRWRDASEVNVQSLVPSKWDLDVDLIGREKFISGIGGGDDLLPIEVNKSEHSIYARIKPGFYWTGPDRYYLPSDDSAIVIDQVRADGGFIALGGTPRQQKPIFVGALKIDHEGYYDTMVRYERANQVFDPAGPEYQFLLDSAAQTIQLNKGFPLGRLFLGIAPEAPSVLFDLPVYPVGTIDQVVLGVYGNQAETAVPYEIDARAGTITVTFPDPAAAAGRDLYVQCAPAVIVVFETKPDVQRNSLQVPVDLNPAFAGISQGYLYLENRKKRVASIQLYCDKPRILTPIGYDMVSGLVSFGPVYYEGDFALLQAAALSFAGDPIPGARLKVVPSGLFGGTVNYKDPVLEDVTVTTGGDGIASFVYTPPASFGQSLALSSIAGNDVNLPAPIPIQQLWNADEGWLTRLYSVLTNDGFFGKIGADPEYGEIRWKESGVPGTVGYSTNGKRVLLQLNGAPLLPVTAYDIAGVAHTDPAFDGNVVKITYAALPSGAPIGSFFLSYIGRITLQVQAEDSLILSNVILLDLQTPIDIVDESGVSGYLDLNSGRLNINRLGGAPIMPLTVNVSRY